MALRMSHRVRLELVSVETQFRKACEQVFLLSRQVEEATQRYQEAEAGGHKVLRYNIRLRLSVLEGVRNMFYEFAAKKAADIVNLQRLVLAYDDDVITDSDDDVSDLDDFLFSSSADEYDVIADDSSEEAC